MIHPLTVCHFVALLGLFKIVFVQSQSLRGTWTLLNGGIAPSAGWKGTNCGANMECANNSPDGVSFSTSFFDTQTSNLYTFSGGHTVSTQNGGWCRSLSKEECF